MGKRKANMIKGIRWIVFIVIAIFAFSSLAQGLFIEEAEAAHTLDTFLMAGSLQTTNPATLSYTCGAGTTVLVVMIAHTNASRTGGAPTYNAIAMTQVGAEVLNAQEVGAEIWYLVNPPTGAAYTISVPNVGGTGQRIYAISFKAQSGYTSALDVFNSTNVDGVDPSLGLTTTVNGDAVVDILADGLLTVPTARSHTLINNADEGAWVSEAQYTLQGTAGAITLSHTIALDDVAMIAAAFKEVLLTTTTLGNGTDPGNSTVEPGTANQYLDQFTFVTTNGSGATVSALTVTSTQQTAIDSMQIWNNAMTTQYFTTVNNPGSDTWNFSGGTSIPVTTSSSSYRIVVTFKSHASLAAGTYPVTGRVTAFTTTDTGTAGTDSAGTTITVDNTPPANATWGTITPGDAQITLNWTNPGDGDFAEVVILRNTATPITDAPTDGNTYVQGSTIGTSTVRYAGNAQTFIDTGLTNGQDYYYKIFSRDTYKNYASGVQTGPHTPAAAPCDKTLDATCTECHSMPPGDSATRSWSAGNVIGDHDVLDHKPATTRDVCARCHGGIVNSYDNNHRSKYVEMNSPGIWGAGTYSRGASFLHNATPVTGVCSNTNCHGTVSPQWGVGKTDCASCHKAKIGVAGESLAARHDAHYNSVTNATTRNATNNSTATKYSYNCGICHDVNPTNQHLDGSNNGALLANGWRVDVIFNTAAISASPSASYSNGGSSTSSGDSGFTYWTNGTCSNLYCHSNAKGTYTTPKWSEPDTASCTICHGGPAVTASVTLGSKHAKHMATDSYSFRCVECHNGTVNLTNSAITVFSNHVNGIKNVVYYTSMRDSGINQTGGTYTTGTKTCTSTYCHSTGANTTAPFIAPLDYPVWDTGTTGCASCHKGVNDAVTRMERNKHLEHVLASPNNNGVRCNACHAGTVGTNNTLNSLTNHVNGTKTVIWNSLNNSPSASAYISNSVACSNNYCHSKGTTFSLNAGPNITPNNTTLTWGGTYTGSCANCHDNPPAYANLTTIDGYAKPNSHANHAYTCDRCHYNTTTDGVIVENELIHANKFYNIKNGGTVNFALSVQGYPSPTKVASKCDNITCHGGTGTTATWGQKLQCSDCHKIAGLDVENFAEDGTAAKINGTEWNFSGHGKPSGLYNVSGAPAANFNGAAATGNPCLYCHSSGIAHNLATNPFRLVNNDVTYGWNGNCLVCHRTGSTGYDPPGAEASKNATRKVDKYHQGSNHSAARDGGLFCWDCHDPHGDSVSNSVGPIYMVHRNPANDTDGTYGVPTAQTGTAVSFTTNSSGTGQGAYGDTVTPFNGPCNVCHTGPPAGGPTIHYNATGSDSHNSATVCTSCHKHSKDTTYDGKAFEGAGTCKDCHSSTVGSRRKIVGAGADFVRKSKHVSNGTQTEIVTNFDCIVCHAEGSTASSGTNILDTTDHKDGKVGLRNVDSVGNPGTLGTQYWKWPGSASATTADRNNMDSFCMACHDSTGASGINVNSTNDGLNLNNTRAFTPFNTNDNLRNFYDVTNLGTFRTTTYGKVLNVKGQFNSGNASGRAWASHHNLRQFTLRYGVRNTTAWPAGAWTAYQTKEGVTINSGTGGEIAGLHCSDCHLNEVNAHGTVNTRYMLSDSAGNDATFTASGGSTSTDNCVKCHNKAVYSVGPTDITSPRTQHHDNTRCDQWLSTDANADTASYLSGALADPDTGRQLTCLTCHGGFGDTAQNAWGALGAIHGTNETYTPGGGGGTSKRYRFMSGSIMRFYNPNGATAYGGEANWEESANGGQCYTISALDTWQGASCAQHPSGVNEGDNRTRGLSY